MGIIFKVTTDTVFSQLFYNVWLAELVAIKCKLTHYGTVESVNSVSVLWINKWFQTQLTSVWHAWQFVPFNRMLVIILMANFYTGIAWFFESIQGLYDRLTTTLAWHLNKASQCRRLWSKLIFLAQLCAWMTTFYTLFRIITTVYVVLSTMTETHSLGVCDVTLIWVTGHLQPCLLMLAKQHKVGLTTSWSKGSSYFHCCV